MSDKSIKLDWDKLNALFTEDARWANLSVSIDEIEKENTLLILDLSKYDPATAIPLLASLLTLPELQSHCIRLEILVALAVMHCRGRKKAKITEAVRWFNRIAKSKCVIGEDPAEDVFISLMYGRRGDYRLIEGIWESAGFYTQRVLDVVATMPETGQLGQIKKSVHALLVISDIICEKAGLQRYQLGSDELYSQLSAPKLPSLNSLISRVTITFAELEERGITRQDIEPFLFQFKMSADLPKQQIGQSYLDRFPLIVHSMTHLTVALPSAISVALRNYVISNIIEGKFSESFDNMLALNYSQLFFNTPLLGGPTKAQIHWMKDDAFRYSNFYLKIDEGYFISFHLFLPSVQVHLPGGFKEFYQDEGALTKVLQASINEGIKHVERQEGFKNGLVVLIGCGWGKGYITKEIVLEHPNWRYENMTAADLIRLSWLNDMNPSVIWRIQDGLEAVRKAGVRIININGILNLIGWIRSNNGHLVPHAHLPEGEISPEKPLILNPPQNLLQQVRADANQSYDRHSAVDNTGTWHVVERVEPNPLFMSKSKQRVFVSMEDVRNGTLTSLYEGRLQLWMSVTAPEISDREVLFRLWEMACEWLHRIGNALDARIGVTHGAYNLKVYVEFRDCNLPDEISDKPAPETLFPLCDIEPHSEPGACKAVFQPGFLAGFSIADNIAERLFVRTLTQAYLNLIGVENCAVEAEAIEDLVVPNNNARSFHIFQAQEFVNYVHDTLPQKLITIDPVDEAAAIIGLGWSVLEKGQSNKLNGKKECTEFLRKVVDALLDKIFNALKEFDRISTLTRIVANCEKANAEERHWRGTSAALLGLHSAEPETVDCYIEQMSKFAGAGIASRILIEIGLCVCPAEGGKKISAIELSKLIAHAALLIRIGGFSDAIYYNALTPEIKISPLGDILFCDDFGHMVVEPMLSRMMEERFNADAPIQRKNYEYPGVESQSKGIVSDEFLDIWKIEMGFDLDEARNIIDTLEDKGREVHTIILMMKKSEYLELVCSDKITEDAARQFLVQFSLATRPLWDKPPKGFNEKDIYPWRYGRRLSFVTRPILIVDNSDDPLMIIAPGALRNGFAYVVGGAYYGRLEQAFFKSLEMRNIWWGKAREGHTFNKEVADALVNAGWQVRENIGLPEILNRKIERNFGDIDVLAWIPNRKEVLIIECKDLSSARNYSEIAALLSEYQGEEVDGQADNLRKHLNRVTLLQNNCEQLEQFTGVQEACIVSCLVCSGVVPMQYAKIDALKNTKVGEILDIIKTCG